MNPDLLTQAAKKAVIPFFAIGGITPENLQGLVDRGVRRAAVCRAIISARDPYRESQRFKMILDKVRLNLRG
jgi:thiamine-phosphate pyrophosphorylase